MKIHDSLRQECMPEMVYSICKLAGSKKYSKVELKKLITLDSTDVQTYNKAYRFAVECGFIKEDSSDIVISNFKKEELSDFKNFRYTIFMNIYNNENTTFNELSKWFLSQNSDVFKYKSAQDLSIVIPNDMFSNIEKDYILGFRFWIVALGLGMLQKSGSGNMLVFSCNTILSEWLKNAKPFKKNQTIIMKDFIKTLTEQCPVFSSCINGNNINLALSMGLRVLHINNIIELKYTTDSGNIWHLTNSLTNPATNNITEIIVR